VWRVTDAFKIFSRTEEVLTKDAGDAGNWRKQAWLLENSFLSKFAKMKLRQDAL